MIARSLPDGLFVDTHKGKAYMAIVPFVMRSLRVRCLPPFPGISDFCELNLRTYVRDGVGRKGVWFYSLEADSWISVKIANSLFHLPYRYSRLNFEKSNRRMKFSGLALRDPKAIKMEFDFEIGKQLESARPGSMEHFFVERYRLFTQNLKNEKIFTGSISHPPYEISEAKVRVYSDHLFELNGFDKPSAPPDSALYSKGLDVSVFPLEAVLVAE